MRPFLVIAFAPLILSGFAAAQGIPQINPGGVVDAASYASRPVAPGSIISIFGRSLAISTGAASSAPLPTDINGTRVAINGFPVPLFYVSASQINAQVPWELARQTQASIVVSVAGQAGEAQIIRLGHVGPGIFSMNQQGTGQGAILDSSYRLVTPANPAIAGNTVIQIFCTGLGPVTNQPASGFAAPANTLAETTTRPTIVIGGAVATVLFSGLAPGFVGEYQVNAQVPAAVAGNDVPVVMSIGGITLKTVTIAVQSSAGPGNLHNSPLLPQPKRK